MAVISCNETNARTGGVDKDGVRTYERTFLVEVDSDFTGNLAVRAAVYAKYGVAIDAPYLTSLDAGADQESDSGAVCIGITETCNDDDSGCVWEVKAKYGASDNETNPLLAPPDIKVAGENREQPFDFDVNRKPVVNTAGDPFLTALKKDDSRPVLTVTRNIADYDWASAFAYKDTVNSDTFLGLPPGTAKLAFPSADFVPDEKWGDYWKVTYSFTVDLAGWKIKTLNTGLRELGASGQPIHIRDENTQEKITDPVLLLKNGKKAPKDSPPYVLDFQAYNKMPFSPLVGG